MNTSLESSLVRSLELSLPENTTPSSGSVALSQSGAHYPAGTVGSKTHLLTIPSELAALARATHANDVLIEQMHTVVADPEEPVSPLVLKVLADHATRTGIPIRYTIRDLSGTILFAVDDARTAIPFYHQPGAVLASIEKRAVGSAKEVLEKAPGTSLEMQLRQRALLGRERNFPTRDGASRYGAALLTASGVIYYGGQYSTFEHRLGVHAEMGVLLNALMDGVRDITHLGVVSSKFVDTPCSLCGCCRQFIAELSRAYGFSPLLHLFASGNDRFTSHTIEDFLPLQWSNEKR